MSVDIKDCHPKIIESIERMLIDIKYQMPFYGQFNLNINFRDATKRIPNCGVNVKSSGMYFYYNSTFLDELGTVDGEIKGADANEKVFNEWERQKQINFIILHEDYHLLFNHPQRTVAGRFDPYLANIVQDMIINAVIWQDIDHNFVSIPRYADNAINRAKGIAGKSMALFLPKEYIEEHGLPIFEQLYNWIRDKKREHDDADGENSGPAYGEFGTTGENGQDMDTFSLDNIFDNLNDTQGQYMDSHMEDDVPEELRESMVQDVIERMRSRGLVKGNIEKSLEKLRKKKKDYLREIKRSLANEIMGDQKIRTITRPNRRGIKGIKGNRKVKHKINVILDTSGSMSGMIEKILEYVFRNDISINLFQIDTEIQDALELNSMRDFNKINLSGFGGTCLQPGINLLSSSKQYNKFNTVILTDGYCDTLDMSRLKGKVLGITCGDSIPISHNAKGGYREIVIEELR